MINPISFGIPPKFNAIAANITRQHDILCKIHSVSCQCLLEYHA